MPKHLPLAGALLAATALAAPQALAQPVTGPYVSLGAGYNFLQDSFVHSDAAVSGIPGQPAGIYAGDSNPFQRTGDNQTRYRWGNGFEGEGSLGYGLSNFSNGLRAEFEGLYLNNDVSTRTGSPIPGATHGHRDTYGGMFNLLYDVDLNALLGIPTFGLSPYVGVGMGYVWTHLSPLITHNVDGSTDRVGGTEGGVAYQAIVGFAYPLNSVMPGLDLTVDYRYMGTFDNGAFNGTHYQTYGTNRGNVHLSSQANHTIMVGLRYALFQPPPPPPPAPPAPPPPAPVVQARTYLVFFDWDRADLTERARQIVAEAAQASQHTQTTRIQVNGYTDLSGTAAYNLKLSVRRARSVEAELVRDGVPQNEIEIHGYGESDPLVPTANGVREPQNRRVQIILQ